MQGAGITGVVCFGGCCGGASHSRFKLLAVGDRGAPFLAEARAARCLQMEVIPSAPPWAGLSQSFQAQQKSVGAKPCCGACCVQSRLCLKSSFVCFSVTLNLSLEMSAN